MTTSMEEMAAKAAALRFEVDDALAHDAGLPSEAWVLESCATMRQMAAWIESQVVEIYQAWIEAGGVPS